MIKFFTYAIRLKSDQIKHNTPSVKSDVSLNIDLVKYMYPMTNLSNRQSKWFIPPSKGQVNEYVLITTTTH